MQGKQRLEKVVAISVVWSAVYQKHLPLLKFSSILSVTMFLHLVFFVGDRRRQLAIQLRQYFIHIYPASPREYPIYKLYVYMPL